MPAVGNFAWLIADNGIRLIAGLLVGLVVARYLGPELFGLLNYSLAFVSLLMPLVHLGLDAVVRRRLIEEPEEAGRLLAAVARMRLGAAAISYLGLAGYVFYVEGFSEAGRLVLVLGLTLFQPAAFTADLWLQSSLRARVTVVTSWVALLIGSGAKIWLIWHGADLVSFAWVVVVESALGCGLLFVAGWRVGLPRMAGSGLWAQARELISGSWMLLLSGIAVTLYMKLDIVMLRTLSGDREAGIYAAAVRFSELGYFVPVALASSILPALLRKKAEGPQPYAAAMQRFYDLNAVLAYAMIGSTVLLAKPLIALAYGPAFSEATPVLQLHAWAAIFVFLGVARSQFLINERRYLFSLITTVMGAASNVVLNLWLIPEHGALGAAWATLVAYGIAAWGGSWLHRDVRSNAFMQTRALLLPLFGWRYLIRK